MSGYGNPPLRPAGREHIPDYPPWLLFLRFAQLGVGLIVLGLDAYGLSLLSFDGDELNMFTCVATLITCVYIIVALLAAPLLYNYWAVLGLDILMAIFWLTSFALMASEVAPWLQTGTECYLGYCFRYGLTGTPKVLANCMAAVAGLGGLNFLLFVLTLVFGVLALVRHRAQGLHCHPGQTGEKAVAMQSVPQAQPDLAV